MQKANCLQSPALTRQEYLAYVACLFALMAVSAKSGADAAQYFDWVRYFVSGQLSALDSYPKSPTGLPLVQWQYGVGLLGALPNLTLGLSAPLSIIRLATLLGVANIGLSLYLIRSYIRTPYVAAMTITSFILFTPAGYYLNAFCAESCTICLVLIGTIVLDLHKRQKLNPLACAILLGMVLHALLIVKTVNLAVCLGLAAIFAVDTF